ncbi:MAG: GNAT family N-acetyltransferase [Oscillospiraceae bacterium]|nr:GNAT family N-acetyltransferase [Oscillospiraceae bacterium]
MTHKGTITLETERLILRRFELTDAEAMFRNWANNNDKIAAFLNYQSDGSFADINYWISEYSDNSRYCWAIVLKSIGEPIGYINAHDIDEFVDMAEIGYAIGEKFCHKGIATEAANAVIKFFFEEVGAAKITAKHRPTNSRSGGVMTNAGMKFLGVRRNAHRAENVGTDLNLYAILAEDYFNPNNQPN